MVKHKNQTKTVLLNNATKIIKFDLFVTFNAEYLSFAL